MEKDTENETASSSGGSPANTKPGMTLKEAIELGEYDLEYLATFVEWNTLPKHTQFQYIKKALDIRERQLIQQWSEVSNFLDFSKKPELKITMDNIWKQRKKLLADRERLYLLFSDG